MSLSVRVRFEVFKRDRFTCAYCGKHPPDVLLEADHIMPRAAGGSDDMSNLVTACSDCNRGKSDRLLDEGSRPSVSARTVAALEERLAQARAYVELLGALSNVTDAMLSRVNETWARAFNAETVERDGQSFWLFRDNGAEWLNEGTVRTFLHDLSLEDLHRAIDMTASKFGNTGWKRGADRYFYGICWRMVRERQAAGSPVLNAEVEDLRAEVADLQLQNAQLRDKLDEAEALIQDLRINVRRLREEAGRE